MEESSNGNAPAESLDLRGVECPENANKTLFALELMDEGEVLELILDDSDPCRRLLETLAQEGHGVEEKARDAASRTVWIHRADD